MAKQKYILAALGSLILVSCDCGQIADGIVLDKTTKRPIEGVKVRKQYLIEQTYQPNYLSDSLGKFRVHFISGGVFRCPDLELSFSKQGYVTQKVSLESISHHDTIYLEKVKGY